MIDRKYGVGRGAQGIDTGIDFAAKRLVRRGHERATALGLGIDIGNEPEPVEMADEFAFDDNIAVRPHDGQQVIAVLHAGKCRRAAVNKSLCKTLMQCIRNFIL